MEPDAGNFPSARSKRPTNHSPQGGAKLFLCFFTQASLGLSLNLYHKKAL